MECKRLGTVKNGPACGCAEGACALEIDEQQWPSGAEEDTLDINPQGEEALASWTLVKPHGIKIHQRSFGITRRDAEISVDHEAEWEAQKWACLGTLLEQNGLKLTYDTFYDQIADQHMGRWTLEEVTT